jgi:hypothetical protein
MPATAAFRVSSALPVRRAAAPALSRRQAPPKLAAPQCRVLLAVMCAPGAGAAGGADDAGEGHAEDGESADVFEQVDEQYAGGLEAMFEEALMSLYSDAPLFSEPEFLTLRDELEHLGASSIRLNSMEKVWIMASQERDFDRRIRKELELSEADLAQMKEKLLKSSEKRRLMEKQNVQAKSIASSSQNPGLELFSPRPVRSFGLSDAEVVGAAGDAGARIRFLLFGDATEERLKIAILYLPALLLSFISVTAASLFFAYLDGEMTISISQVGRLRLGITSYVVAVLTVLASNKITPAVLEFLDLGQPRLIRGACPNCTNSVSCLFTGNTRVRDERRCSVCGAVVGFNQKYAKVYLISSPGARKYSKPD